MMTAQTISHSLANRHPGRLKILFECIHNGPKEKHHPDYRNPYHVEMLCHRCHGERRTEIRINRMAYVILNHTKIRKEMEKRLWRPIDLANELKINRQLTNYILYHGGAKYVKKLAKVFNCKREDLLVMNTDRN